ncbi:hypothetical protein TWF481_011698 [Arthrobotrys musiformis]|uniref:Uncharacterized protein n=1 Tax=Arthrobotrys musiformis TaxID=47236 RepID=A0AAV9W0G8_9PEZI
MPEADAKGVEETSYQLNHYLPCQASAADIAKETAARQQDKAAHRLDKTAHLLDRTAHLLDKIVHRLDKTVH